MKSLQIHFTVHGSTQSELDKRARETLVKLLEGREPVEFTLDARPLAEANEGGVVMWEADVEAIA